MELLIIRSGDDYIRVLEGGFEVCGMDKASVFRLEKLDTINSHIRELDREGFSDIRIHKLTITETPFKEI